ncbi:MAG: hypothetical protein MK211_08265 [Flavobacteriales bacterium]|jgi:uncharacterized protein YbaR (Trm112 family)|uniref:hypothetical protein n=1 Tax=Candidatus Ulvibacter alkanivorans TaxID=2267620 RepID=UPI000DF30B28|nr:hypothetical protein [Candidatus Ulvibacter alkanivorans]MCH2490128.1 hypothetical protein [Flavobacteriales bacterium]
MEATSKVVHTATISNNCPICYANDGLEFTFTQQIKDTPLYSKSEKNVNGSLYCHNCNSAVYPVNWTEDIERVNDYHKKLAVPEHQGIKLKPLAYVIIVADLLVLIAIVYFVILR